MLPGTPKSGMTTHVKTVVVRSFSARVPRLEALERVAAACGEALPGGEAGAAWRRLGEAARGFKGSGEQLAELLAPRDGTGVDVAQLLALQTA